MVLGDRKITDCIVFFGYFCSVFVFWFLKYQSRDRCRFFKISDIGSVFRLTDPCLICMCVCIPFSDYILVAGGPGWGYFNNNNTVHFHAGISQGMCILIVVSVILSVCFWY